MTLRSGHLAVGNWQVTRAVSTGRAQLVLVAADAGAAVRRDVERWAREEGVRAGQLPLGQQDLGRALGRRQVAVVAVLDAGLAARLQRELDRGTISQHGGEPTDGRKTP